MIQKHYFTKNNQRVGKKSGKPRGKYKKQGKTEQQGEIILQEVKGNQEQKQQSPNIYRLFSEKINTISLATPKTFSLKQVGIVVFALVIVGVSAWQGVGAMKQLSNLQESVENRVKLAREMGLWEAVAAKYPTYRDAYFQAAVLAYRLGDKQKERIYVAKTLEIDPNYVPAQRLEKLL